VNATLGRALDFNDFGPAGHPSDMVPSLLAVAESTGATGADLLRGVHVAYEVATALADIAPIAEQRWDMGTYLAAGAAAGMASTLRLDPPQAASAVAMAVVPNVALRATRESPASRWRSSATPYACMGAAFACRMARAGLTGPAAPFEGRGGLFELSQIDGVLQLDGSGRPTAVERGALKVHPACFVAQSAFHAAVLLQARLDGADVQRVTVDTTPGTWMYTGGGRGDAAIRWDPPDREAADHSLPYIVANVLLDGRADEGIYAPARLADRRWAPLIERIEVRPDDGLAVAANAVRMTVELADGRVLTETSTFPYDADGRSVVGDDDVRRKYDHLTSAVLDPVDAAALHDAVTGLAAIDDLDQVTRHLRAFRRRP
jgi:2-methylcitrate dehydratase